MPIPVARLNHAVLFVRDAERAAEFYGRLFGFEIVGKEMGGQAIFMRSPLGRQPPRPRAVLGRAERAERAARLGRPLPPRLGGPDDRGPRRPRPRPSSEAGALGGASDHGVSKSLYGRDPDGNEFEIMWRVPREAWGEAEHAGRSCRSTSMPS